MSERDCSHCRNHTDDGCKKWKCEYVPNDLIKRQDAIDAICTWDKFGVDERCRLVRWHEGLEPYVHLRDVVTAIANLPSAQRKGKWIEEGDIDYPCVCSVCGTKQDIKAKFLFSFCPNCGARMGGNRMSDLINRRDAIDVLKEHKYLIQYCLGDENEIGKVVENCISKIKGLPSAQLSPCDVCRYYPPSAMDGKACTMCAAEGGEQCP